MMKRMATTTAPTARKTRAAADIRPGDKTFIPMAGFVRDAYPLTSGAHAGMIYIEFQRPLDDSGNHWRIYPADHRFEMAEDSL